MRKLLVPIALLVLSASSALGGEQDAPLEVNLSNPPSSRNWINLEDCAIKDSFKLSISWSLPDASPYSWTGPQEADVFLATSESCSTTGAVEIRDVAGQGVDAEIDEQEYSGIFPEQGDEDLFLAEVTGLNCEGESTEQDYFFCIRWEWEDVYYDIIYVFNGGAEIRFDINPPQAPSNITLSPGEENIKVSWDPPSDDDIIQYKIYFQVEGTSDFDHITKTGESVDDATIEGLSNGVVYEIWVTAVDKARNEGAKSNVVTGMPEPVEDYFEHYKDAGGAEEGGFCFVATAASGSYQSAMVLPLRAFRDSVLMSSAAGRELVSGYYRYGPRWARAIQGSDTHRSIARWSLAPVVAFAEASNQLGLAETLILLGGALILLVLLLGLFRKVFARARQVIPPLVVVIAVFGLSSAAQAQVSSVPDFQLQIRLGPYYPDVDEEDGLTGEPFKDIYGSGSEVLFELGIDYELWQGFGTATAGASMGFVQYIGKALTQSGAESSDTTVFNIMPFRLSVGYHFDVLAQRYGIPLAPYLGGGLSYYVWWATDGVGDISEWESADGDKFSASGGIFGMHFFGGLKLLLDMLDPEAATNFEVQVGVINTYLFAEYTVSWIDGFGSDSHMDLSDANFMFGLMMEF